MPSVSEAQLMAWITPFLWPFLRALALMSSLPVLGQRSVPVRVRVGFAALVALGAQAALPPMPDVALDSPMALAIAAQQVVIGLTMGFAVRLIFAAAELGGELVGLQMGLNFAGFFDPVSASQGTATARFLGTLTSYLFIVINGHLLVVAALIQSFHAFPVAPEPLAIVARLMPHQWASLVFQLGLMIALPIVGMLMFVNLALGFVSRVAPQINIFAVGFPITLGVGLLGLMATLPAMHAPLQSALESVLARFL